MRGAAMKVQKKKPYKPVPNCKRAIVTGKIATIYKGRRIVQRYESGQPLMGDIENDR